MSLLRNLASWHLRPGGVSYRNPQGRDAAGGSVH